MCSRAPTRSDIVWDINHHVILTWFSLCPFPTSPTLSSASLGSTSLANHLHTNPNCRNGFKPKIHTNPLYFSQWLLPQPFSLNRTTIKSCSSSLQPCHHAWFLFLSTLCIIHQSSWLYLQNILRHWPLHRTVTGTLFVRWSYNLLSLPVKGNATENDVLTTGTNSDSPQQTGTCASPNLGPIYHLSHLDDSKRFVFSLDLYLFSK